MRDDNELDFDTKKGKKDLNLLKNHGCGNF